jgi:hypothetical protein
MALHFLFAKILSFPAISGPYNLFRATPVQHVSGVSVPLSFPPSWRPGLVAKKDLSSGPDQQDIAAAIKVLGDLLAIIARDFAQPTGRAPCDLSRVRDDRSSTSSLIQFAMSRCGGSSKRRSRRRKTSRPTFVQACVWRGRRRTQANSKRSASANSFLASLVGNRWP